MSSVAYMVAMPSVFQHLAWECDTGDFGHIPNSEQWFLNVWHHQEATACTATVTRTQDLLSSIEEPAFNSHY